MEKDFATLELLNSRPKLRGDLHFKTQEFDNETTYLLEDPIRSKFFRIGLPEYRFLQYLNGFRTVGEALNLTSGELGDQAIDEHESATIIDFMFENELFTAVSESHQEILSKKRKKQQDSSVLKKLNLLFLKMPLFNPDKALNLCIPWLKWLLSKGFAVVWVLAFMSAIVALLSNSSQFGQQASQMFSANNVLWMVVAWVLLKCIHELFHGLVCKKYGGNVYEAGVIWILFAPIGYVDATSSWMFQSKWQRIFTAAAGMYIEIFIAAIFTWVWVLTDFGPLKELAFNIVVLASITTLLFNANPLMKFDGYYIFSDLVEVPNLYGEGMTYVRHLGKKYLLMDSTEFPERSKRESRIIKIYGVASFVWRMFIMATIFIIASQFFHGLGLLLVIISSVIMFGIPLFNLFKYLKERYFLDKGKVIWMLTRFSLLVLGMFLVFTQLQFKQDIKSPAIVDYSNKDDIHAKLAGFVSEVLVEDGETVKEGQAVLRLVNPELRSEYGQLSQQLRKISVQRRSLLLDRKITELQALDDRITSIRSQLAVKKEKLDNLFVKAQLDGAIFLNSRFSAIGQFVSEGEKLGTIAGIGRNKVYSLFHQRHFGQLEGKQGQATRVAIGEKLVNGVINRITPNASKEVNYPELTTVGGGSISVFSSQDGSSNGLQLLDAHFKVEIDIIGDEQFKPGQTGIAEVQGNSTSIGKYWYETVSRWVDKLATQI